MDFSEARGRQKRAKKCEISSNRFGMSNNIIAYEYLHYLQTLNVINSALHGGCAFKLGGTYM